MQLLHLDISFNNITLSERTVRTDSFHGLSKLRTLKMKQNKKPEEFDYAAVAVLNETLEELYITGTPTFSKKLIGLSKLNTLSLGGSQCNITSMTYNDQPALSALPLARLSARNCRIRRIDRAFLHNMRETLERLDLSCNHLKEFLREITLGVGSKLHTLILDNINREGVVCPWNNESNSDLVFLNNTDLKMLSLQANQLKSTGNLNLRDTCSKLIYLDISQNDFNGAAFYIARIVQGQPIPSADLALFYNKNLQPPALRFIGMQALTKEFSCGRYDRRILNCDEDSPLFLDDEFYWNHNHQSDIMDYQLLVNAMSAMSQLDLTYIWLGVYSTDDVVSLISTTLENMNVNYTPHRAINNTIYYLVQEADGLPNIPSYLQNVRYFLTNVTTFALGYNNFVTESEHETLSGFCSSIYMYPNNADTLNFSYSNFAFGVCNQVIGFKYLTNISCTECGLQGWQDDTFQNIPLKNFEVSKNKLGRFLRDDEKAERLKGAPLLERLYLGEQQDGGIKYFSNSSILFNQPSLTHLDLQRNSLHAWNISIAANRHLLLLDLRDNEISYIEEAFRREINDQNEETALLVYLEGNDIQCTDHSSLLYIDWLLNSSAIADAHKIRCAESKMTIMQYLRTQQQPPNEDIIYQENVHLFTIIIASIFVLTVLGTLLIGWTKRYTIIYRWYHRKVLTSKKGEDTQNRVNINVYASYSKKHLEDIICVQKRLQESASHISIITRDRNATPGLMTQVSIAKLIAKSDRLILFLTPDYLEDATSRFEFELFKHKDLSMLTLIICGIESVQQLKHLPALIKDIISNEKHIDWPKGQCTGSASKERAAVEALSQRLGSPC
ncbi:uncharacterized protein [Watersipora subatra]|uniref:uncharacterized protein n=1 Tax=Watersipora subatra TaxID=2589382 RepID=UPI00355AFACC